MVPAAAGGHESDREPGGCCVETCSLEDGDHLIDAVQLGEMQLLYVGAMPRRHQRAAGVNTHNRVVDATGHQGVEDRPGVHAEVVEQVEHLVAERCIEATPSGRHRAGSLELEGPLPGEPTGVLDRARGWVVTETLGDAAPVGEQPEEPAPVAPHVENPLAGEVDFDRIEHRRPDERVLVLHRLIRCRVPPIGLAHDPDTMARPVRWSGRKAEARTVAGDEPSSERCRR